MTAQTDPALEHIRRVRHEISAEFGHDPYRLVEYYMQLQEQNRHRLLPTTDLADSGKAAA